MNFQNAITDPTLIIKFKKKKIIVKDEYTTINKNNVRDLLDPYKNNEYLPANIINPLIINTFETGVILHEYNSYNKLIKIKIQDLFLAPFTNWQYNRPADICRCEDIARYIYLSKQTIDNIMLYVSFNNKTRSFDILDGNHRYNSLKMLKEQNSKPLDLITPSEFGNNNDAEWLYNSYILLNIRINASDGELIELFKNLNKTIPVPDLYIRDTNKDKKDIIENVVNKWNIKYKSHFSSKDKPNKPNVNRDRFIDLLDKVYEKYQISEENKNILEQKLDQLNTKILYELSDLPKKKRLSEQILEKCNDTGCYLFIYDINIILEKI
jgi:hypothetical protein